MEKLKEILILETTDYEDIIRLYSFSIQYIKINRRFVRCQRNERITVLHFYFISFYFWHFADSISKCSFRKQDA